MATMEDLESAAFLSGQGIPVALGAIDEELARLWGPGVEREGGPDVDAPAVTRVSLANLVVAALADGASRVAGALDTVVTMHPCRVIALRPRGDDDRSVTASIAAHCTLPAPGVPQVCSERIILAAGEGALDLLPGAVRPLLEPDLPLVIWWLGDPRPQLELFHNLARDASRLIPDLPDPYDDHHALVALLDPLRSECGYSRDLAWFGISRWRELVAGLFDPPGSDELLSNLHHVEIVARGRNLDRPTRAAAWLAAWLAGQLRWRPRERSITDRGVEAVFSATSGPVNVVIETRDDSSERDARIERVALRARADDPERDDQFEIVRIGDTEHVRIETCSQRRCALGRVVHAVEPDHAHRVAASLESSRNDPPYRTALPIMLWLLGVDARAREAEDAPATGV